MAMKEKALRRLAEKLGAAGVPFTVGASWLLVWHGVLDEYHDFDVMVPPEHAEAADRVLSRLGMRSEAGERDGSFHASYHFDGADIDLCTGMAFEGGLRAVIDGDPAGCAEVLGARVPLGFLEDWYVWYSLMGRTSRAEALARFFADHPPEHPDRFRQCVNGALPESIEKLIAAWTGKQGHD